MISAISTAYLPPSTWIFVTSSPVSGAGINLDGITLYESGGSFVRIEQGRLAFSPTADVSLEMYMGRVSGLEVSLDGEMEIDMEISADLPSSVTHEGVAPVWRVVDDMAAGRG